MEITEDFKKYLSGFFDEDGSITIEKQKLRYTLRIKFSQSNENWIYTIKKYYPYLKKSSTKRDNNKIEYELRAAGKQIEPIINNLLQYSILKYEQLLEAKKFIKLINKRNKSDEKELIYKKLKQLKIESNNKPYERLNIQYISGLFDAEGSIGVYKDLRVKITQKSDIKILENIAKLYDNTNKIDNYSIAFYGKNSQNILKDIKKYCIYKLPQIKAALKYIGSSDKEIRNKYKDIIKNEKLKN